MKKDISKAFFSTSDIVNLKIEHFNNKKAKKKKFMKNEGVRS